MTNIKGYAKGSTQYDRIEEDLESWDYWPGTIIYANGIGVNKRQGRDKACTVFIFWTSEVLLVSKDVTKVAELIRSYC